MAVGSSNADGIRAAEMRKLRREITVLRHRRERQFGRVDRRSAVLAGGPSSLICDGVEGDRTIVPSKHHKLVYANKIFNGLGNQQVRLYTGTRFIHLLHACCQPSTVNVSCIDCPIQSFLHSTQK